MLELRSILFIFLMMLPTLLLKAQEPVVTDVRIRFFVPAGSEDKGLNTQVSASLYTSGGRLVAKLNQCCGNIRFTDTDFTSASYQLNMYNEIRKAEIQTGYFTIHIDATASDRWIFVPDLKLLFSDGSKAEIKGEGPDLSYQPRLVSEKAPDTSFPFHLQ